MSLLDPQDDASLLLPDSCGGQATGLPLMRVRNLRVEFPVRGQGTLTAVDGVDLDVNEGEILGLVGESGCGKTVLSLSLLRLIEKPGRIKSGQVLWNGRNLLGYDEAEMRSVRGRQIAMIFQNPQASLNPVHSVGGQLVAISRLHQHLSPYEARAEALRLLKLVQIPDPERAMSSFPHQFSGGMCQRIMIAMALSCRPRLLIADEPTSSLDVTVQAQIMDLLLRIRDEFGMAILLVSHDLGVIARMCDRIAVMYLGRIVESAGAIALYSSPKHPYTQALLQSVPVPDPTRRGKQASLPGDVPSAIQIPTGCRFRTRCSLAFDRCVDIDPSLLAVNGTSHSAACLLYERPETKS